jgi:hypothetical protein
VNSRTRSCLVAAIAVAQLLVVVERSPGQDPCREWTPLGDLSAHGGTVRALAPFREGSWTTLGIGGAFHIPGAVPGNNVARWTGTEWLPMSFGLNSGDVWALTEWDDGTGPTLYAGGTFTHATGELAHGVGRWTGTRWADVGGGVGGAAYAMTSFDDGGGSALYVAGDFSGASGAPNTPGIAKWNGSRWSGVGGGLTLGRGFGANALAVFDDGAGPELYVAGIFSAAGGTPARNIARWNGSAWSPVGSGIDSWAYEMTVADDGSGPALFVAGALTNAGGIPTRVAKWQNGRWSAVGPEGGPTGSVIGLVGFDDGTGPALFALDVGISGSRLLKWNGAVWSVAAAWGPSFGTGALTVFDDGTGPCLFAATSTFGDICCVAKWDARRGGSVNSAYASPYDVLTIGGPAGASARLLRVGVGDPVTVSLGAAPAGPGRPRQRGARYILWMWPGARPHPVPLLFGGETVGCLVDPSPSMPAAIPQPLRCVHSDGIPPVLDPCASVRTAGAPARAPWTMSFPGSPTPLVVTIQGVLEDGGASNSLGVSVTNAVVLRVE